MFGNERSKEAASPELRDKRVAPPGVLPKNTQALVLTSLALVMVIVIAFSGRNAPREKPASLPSSAQTPVSAADQIREYEARLKSEAQKVQRAQEQLVQTQHALGLAPAEGTTQTSPNDPASAMRFYGISPANDQNQFYLEALDREAKSRFASNVALSFRASPAPPLSSAPARTATEMVADALRTYTPTTPASTSAAPNGAGPGAPASAKENSELDAAAAKARAAKRDAEIDRFAGKVYRLYEGTVLETVLTNRLDGSFSGPVDCLVTTNVYSHDGLHVLIPQGSRALGEARKVETFGDQRLAVFFHRIVMPDGYSVSLDKFQGLNQIGETGLSDQIDHHYIRVFGVSLAIGAIAGFSQANTNYGVGESSSDAYRQGVSSSLAQSSTHILDRYLNVLPTITIREGHRVKVYLSDDLLLPAYEKHRLSSDQ